MHIISLFILWIKIKFRKDALYINKGCGYYIPVRVLGVKPIGKVEEWEMVSGRTAIVKLKKYEIYSDPDDMIKNSTWELIGYIGEKKISEMSFLEFKKFMERANIESSKK